MLENSLASELILPNGKGSRQVSSGIIHLLGLFTMKWKNESLVRGTELNEKWVRLVDIKKRRTIKMNQLSRSGLPWPPLFYLSNSNRRIVMSYSLHRDPVGEASLSLLLYNALYCMYRKDHLRRWRRYVLRPIHYKMYQRHANVLPLVQRSWQCCFRSEDNFCS